MQCGRVQMILWKAVNWSDPCVSAEWFTHSENSTHFTQSHCRVLGCNVLFERSTARKRWHKDHTQPPLSDEHPLIYRAAVTWFPALPALRSALLQVRMRANYLRFLYPLKAVWCLVMQLIHMIARLESEWAKYRVIKISTFVRITFQTRSECKSQPDTDFRHGVTGFAVADDKTLNLIRQLLIQYHSN